MSVSPRVDAVEVTIPRWQLKGTQAEDDPNWTRLGITNRSTLANITLSAKRDRRVAATIAAGLYDNAIVFFDRLSRRDPQNLPALDLDGPLLLDGCSDDPEVPLAVDATYAEAALQRLRARP